MLRGLGTSKKLIKKKGTSPIGESGTKERINNKDKKGMGRKLVFYFTGQIKALEEQEKCLTKAIKRKEDTGRTYPVWGLFVGH